MTVADLAPVELVRASLVAGGSRIVSDKGDSFMAQCLAHPDGTPSLHVATGEDGRALLTCHAGCDLEAVLDAMGLHPRDVYENCYKDKDEAVRDGERVPCPCNTSERRERPELYELWDAYESGRLAPVDVPLGALPGRASDDEHRAAAFLRIAIGLRYADGDRRAFPCSTRFLAEEMGWGPDGHVRASRVLRRLERWGVIVCAGELQRRGQPRGTKTYAPPSLGVGAPAVERYSVAVKVPEVEPGAVVAQELRVDGADLERRDHNRVVAAGDGALAGDRPLTGRSGTTLDLVHERNPSAGRAEWVGDGVVGRWVWPSAATADGKWMAF